MKNLTTNSIILIVVILIIVIGASATVYSLRNTREKIDSNKETMNIVTENENKTDQEKDFTDSIDNNKQQVSESSSKNIRVIAPLPGDKLSSPYIIRGEAIAFEGTVNYTLLDDQGNTITDGFTTALSTEMGEYGEFNQPITFNASSKNGILEVYTLSAKDGSKQDIVRINVKF
jgi:type II secretory pathway pseudopilin PulG